MAGEVLPHDVRPQGKSLARAPVRVVLGGGIGAGKSSVAQIFEERGFRVVSADVIGRRVLADGSATASLVYEMWPSVLVQGAIDRDRLAGIVFADTTELARLESITHPEIIRVLMADVAAHHDEDMIIETPLPGVVEHVAGDRIAVIVDRDIRLARTIARGSERGDVQRRMDNQPDDQQWREWADIVIDNSGPWADTERVIHALIDGMVVR